jgi:hypothetical protein
VRWRQYRINGRLFNALTCHCSMCRKVHGAAFRSRATVKAAEWVQGEEAVTFYESSPGNRSGFSRVCGSPILSKFDDHPNYFGLPLGALDDDPGIRPELHMHVASKVYDHRQPPEDTWRGGPLRKRTPASSPATATSRRRQSLSGAVIESVYAAQLPDRALNWLTENAVITTDSALTRLRSSAASAIGWSEDREAAEAGDRGGERLVAA